MDCMKFTHATSTELNLDGGVTGVKLGSYQNNLALYGSSSQVVLFELIKEAEFNDTFPYGISQAEVSQTVPCSMLIKNIDIARIYANCSVQEAQQLALEPLYLSNLSPDVQAKVAQVDWMPMPTQCEYQMLALLSTFGACELFSKSRSTRVWRQKPINLHSLYYSDVFSLKRSLDSIQEFGVFKALIDLYWITALAWCAAGQTRVIYTANAAGYIVAFQLSNEYAEDVKHYFTYHTNLGKISYIKSFDTFLLIANQKGAIHLFRIEHGELPKISEVECLWSRTDRMVVHKAEVSLVPELNSYIVVFTKAAHVLAYRLTLEGHIMCSATLYVGAMSITGLQKLAEKEFIITSINGSVRHIRVSSSHNEELTLDEQILETDIDAEKMQILGVSATCNRNLWPFLLHRNRGYTRQSKYRENTVFINVCRLSSIDSLTVLSNLNVKCMDAYIDYVLAIRIDVLNNTDMEKYDGFYSLVNAKFPKQLNDAFLQKLQIKRQIINAVIKYQKVKCKVINKPTSCEHDFVEVALQITHILCRLQHLQKVTAGGNTPLQPFPKLAINCMRAKCLLLIAELTDQANDENPLKLTTERFSALASVELTSQCSNDYCCSEQCLQCDQQVDAKSMLCPSAHKVSRCCVSYVQLPLFNKRYCSNCKCYALDDDASLQLLFAPDEAVTCTFCRFYFVHAVL